MKKIGVVLLVLFFLGGCGDEPAAPTQPPSLTQPPSPFAVCAIPTQKSNPNALVVGPDDAIWFPKYDAGKIGQLTFQGAITEFPLPYAYCNPAQITVGPDKNLCYTEFSNNAIERLTTPWTLTEISIPTADSNPEELAKLIQ